MPLNKMKYILGGGIAGLIFAYYNKDYRIISPDIGGQFKNHFPLGPRYLHQTKEAKEFLKELGMPIKPMLIRIGYWHKGKFIKPDQEFRQQYFMKSRGKDNLDGFDETVMTGDKREFTAIQVDFEVLIAKLRELLKDRIIIDKIQKINLTQRKLLGEKEEYQYEKLISSIPKCFFLKMAGLPCDKLKSRDVTYVLLDGSYLRLGLNDYVYYLKPEAITHRLTRAGDQIVADVVGAREEKELKEHFGEYYKDHRVLKGAQIVSGDVTLYLLIPFISTPVLDSVNASSLKYIVSIDCISWEANCKTICKSLSLLVDSINKIAPDFFVRP